MIIIILIIKVNDDDDDGVDDNVGDDWACQEVARPQPLPVPPRALEQPGQPVQVLLPSTVYRHQHFPSPRCFANFDLDALIPKNTDAAL